jgi:hypothetical protein
MGHRWETPGDFPESYATKTLGTGKTLILAGIVNDSNGGDNYAYTFPITAGAVPSGQRGKGKHSANPPPCEGTRPTSEELAML